MAATVARPRVLVLTTWYPSQERPLEAPFNARHVAAIATVSDVRVIHARLGGSARRRVDTVNGLTVERLPMQPRHPLAALRSLARIVRYARGADVVHTMAFSSILVAALVRPWLPRAWVHTEHWSVFAGGAGHGVWESRARLLGRLLRLPTVVTAVSADLAAALAGRARQVVVVPNVVEPAQPVPPLPAKPPLRLVTVGALIDRKQPLMAVQTLARLRQLGQDAVLEFVGDGELRDAVAAEAARLGVGVKVRVAGSVPVDDVGAHLAAAHVFFLPTLAETFLVAAAEAIAAGRPVVLGGTGGFTEYVEPANGVIVASHDADAYARAILDVAQRLDNPHDVARTIGARLGSAGVAESFTRVYARARESRPHDRDRPPAS